MARPRSTNSNLPPHMMAVKSKKATYYYFDQGAGSKPRYKSLGTEYIKAMKQWAELEGGNAKGSDYTFESMAEKYKASVIPRLGAATQEGYLASVKKLGEFFGGAKLTDIMPLHISQYREWRVALTQGNRDMAVMSTMWNHAREWGMTDRANPCAGIKRNEEPGRDTYITDGEMIAVIEKAARPLALAIELAYLTGQRPADVLKMRETDIRDGCIEIRQGKTKAPMRINIVGRLAALISECKAAKSGKVYNTSLIVGAQGKAISVQWLSVLWKRARIEAGIAKDIQFRDLRAKAVSDKEETTDIRMAQQLAGHSTVGMTEHYSRKRRGKKVDPTR